MTYALSESFRPTGAATSYNGDLLILERRFTLRNGVASRIRCINSSQIEPAAAINAALVAELRAPIVTKNFENIAVRNNKYSNILIYTSSRTITSHSREEPY